MFDGSRVTRRGLQTLTHELFHAVQYNSPLFRDHCSKPPTAWITEGTARAIGWDIARAQIAADEVSGSVDPKEVHGLRDYSTPLHRPASDDDAYHTSSFWRFLAEYNAHFYHGPPTPTAAPSAVDYGYLNALFDRPADALPPSG